LNLLDDMLVMREEIFGPVLPIIGYRNLDDALARIRLRPHPLALYYFGADDGQARKVLDGTASGGVTINDVMTHMYVADMPFGGIGASGMGVYQGEAISATPAPSAGRARPARPWNSSGRPMEKSCGDSLTRRQRAKAVPARFESGGFPDGQ
jgi:hypothetical protein